jgi:hypothetical protein
LRPFSGVLCVCWIAFSTVPLAIRIGNATHVGDSAIVRK